MGGLNQLASIVEISIAPSEKAFFKNVARKSGPVALFFQPIKSPLNDLIFISHFTPHYSLLIPLIYVMHICLIYIFTIHTPQTHKNKNTKTTTKNQHTSSLKPPPHHHPVQPIYDELPTTINIYNIRYPHQ